MPISSAISSIDTSDFTQVEVSVPVQVTNGIPSLPTSFVQGNQLVKLNKENIIPIQVIVFQAS